MGDINLDMLETLEWIASQEDQTFAECSLAEEIIGRAREAAARARAEMPKIIGLAVPAGTKAGAFGPFPGSLDAVSAGCLCPADQPWPHRLHINSACPVHKPEHVKH